MHCDSIKVMLNDFFNKTLSRIEERKVEGHLAECESCRHEFHKLKKADLTLKKVIHEMIAEIEVPNSLNERIKDALALEKRPQSRTGRLLSLAKTPVFAAAMLLVVLTAGLFGYYNLFSPVATQQEVVMSDSPAEPSSPGSSPADRENEVTDADKEAVHDTENEDLQLYDSGIEYDAGIEKRAADQILRQPAEETEEPLEEEPLAAKPSEPDAAMKLDAFEDIQPLLERRPGPSGPISGDHPLAAGAGTPALKGEPYEADGEAGFVPAQPAYLPQGMKLEDVSWSSGTVYQSYRSDSSFVTVSQRRAQEAAFNYDELLAGGEPVTINGAKAVLEEGGLDSRDSGSEGYATVRWQSGQWVFSVSGELSKEEIIKIASSLK